MAKKIKKQTVEEKLKLLYELQKIDSKIDKIRIMRGELPLQVQDLEDEIQGLNTRVEKFEDEKKHFNSYIFEHETNIKTADQLIKKYQKQQDAVRNNREFDSLNKEIEYQNLEIELSEKRIKEYNEKLDEINTKVDETNSQINERNLDLDQKKKELDEIVNETKKTEDELSTKSEKIQTSIEERLLIAYQRIRENMKNGLAIVSVRREACGGCFNKIPPQRKLDIAARTKIIVCEHCGRILVDADLGGTDK